MYLAWGPEIAPVVLTASGLVGDSGKPQAVYFYAFKSGGTAGNVTFFNGTSSIAPATVVFDDTGTINITVQRSPSAGLVFPNGCYASFDGNVTRGTFWYRQILT